MLTLTSSNSQTRSCSGSASHASSSLRRATGCLGSRLVRSSESSSHVRSWTFLSTPKQRFSELSCRRGTGEVSQFSHGGIFAREREREMADLHETGR